MKTVILAALLATVVTALTNTGVENQTYSPWQTGKLYRYDVRSFTLSRLPEGASSGNAFRAIFIVRVKSPGHLLARLEKPQRAQFHQQLYDQRTLPEDLKYEDVKNLEQPFEIKLEGGRVLSLNMPSTLSLAHENLLKGLIGTLQVDLSTHRTMHNGQNTFDRETFQGQFRKMETDVTGDCVTLYTVSPAASEWRRELPKLSVKEQAIEITKSKNYGHCHHRVDYHFGVPNTAEWTGTADKSLKEQFIERSTNARIFIGQQGPIYKAETVNTINVHPHMYGQQKAEVLSTLKLNLVSYEDDSQPQWEQPQNQRLIKSLLYSMTSKPMPIHDRSEESYEQQDVELAEETENRVRRSIQMPKKVVAINKIYIKKRSDNNENIEDSSSSDSTSAYVNDEFPEENEPAYASLYMNPQPHKAMKQNSANAQKLVQEAAQLLQNINNMPKSDFLSKFNILVRVITGMDSEQLSQTSRSIESVRSSDNVVKADMWMIYRDAVAQAGTLPAFKQIVSWIENKKIQGEEAAQVLATLAKTLRYPTKKVMIQFFELAMKPEVAQQEFLGSTALIAATRLINMGQVNNETAHARYPTHMYGRLSHENDNFVLEDILPRLSQALEKAIKQKDSRRAQVLIKAIGLLGHRSILEVFAPYLEGKIPVSTYLRALMVDNLYTLARERDSYTRAVLYSILRNTAEPYEVRVAAAQNIFVAHPSTAMMQGMAQMTHDDPSVQVRAVLKTGIRSAALLKNPRHMNMARIAQAAESMLTKEKFGKQFSLKNSTDYFDSDYELGIMGALSTIGSEDSLFPKYLRYSVRSQTRGWQNMAASVSSVHQLAQKFQEQMNYMWKDMPQQVQSSHKYSASKISEMLNIKRDSPNPLEAALYMNLMNQERFFSFSEEDLKKLPETTKKFFEDLAKGVDMHYTKVVNQAQISVMFPLAIGMPFIYKYREPTVIHIQAKAKGDIKFERTEKFAAIQGEIQFTYARNIDGSVGFLDTLSNQYASAGIVNKAQMNIPVKFDLQMRDGQFKIRLEPLHPEQDTMLVHYSVWPYSANQKKDTLTPISLDPTTKLIERNEKVVSMDYRFGQSTGTQFQLQGYSYSNDYRNMHKMFQSNDLSNIILALYQRDVSSTHFNFRYLGTKSQNKGVTFTAAYDYHYNIKDTTSAPLTPSKLQDVAPNSAERRSEMVKRVASGIKSAKAQIVDLSATFDGSQKAEYVLTAAIAGSLVDQKIQYAFFASKNGANQINGVGKVNRPEVSVFNVREALKRELKMDFDFEIKFGDSETGNIHIQGQTERTKKYTEALEKLKEQRDAANMARRNQYWPDGYKMIVLAHTPDNLKASVTYKDVSPAFKYAVFQAYKMVEQFTNWNADVNPLKTTSEGKLEIEVQNNYLDNIMNLNLNSKYGEVKIKNVLIHPATPGLLSTYIPVMPHERLANFFTGQLFQPYCSVVTNPQYNIIKTFSHRVYKNSLSQAWHVVMQDAPRRKPWEDELVVLSRKPSENQQEVYISYQSETGKDMEIEIRYANKKPSVQVKTNAKMTSEGDLIMYWDDAENIPFLQYFVQLDGVLVLTIRENRLKVEFNGEKLVLLTRQGRNNTRGICGLMSGDRRDDYMTPVGLVDSDEHFTASYALKDNADQKTLELQNQAKQLAYQREYRYTNILRSDEKWQRWQNEDSSENDWEDWSSKKIFRSKGYLKQPRGNCVLSKQVQYYMTASDICISMTPLDACSSHCHGEGYKIQSVQVVCRPKSDLEFQEYVNQVHRGENPQVSGVPMIKQYRVPASCRV